MGNNDEDELGLSPQFSAEKARHWRSPHPVDVRRTLAPLRRGPADPTHRFLGEDLWRTTRPPSGPATLLLRQRDERSVDARAWGPGATEVLDALPALLGVHDDTTDFHPTHPVVLDAHRRHPGLRTPATGRLMEALVPAVVEQKVLGTDAFAAQRRLLTVHGEPAPGPAPAGMRVPPDPAVWPTLASWDWHRAGVDPKRYRALQAATRLGPQLQRLTDSGDRTALYAGLRSVPGIGAWTISEVATRVVGDADAVPWGDYHLGRTVGTGLAGRIVETDAEVAELLEPFRPHRQRVVRLLGLSPFVRVERRGPRMSRVDHRDR